MFTLQETFILADSYFTVLRQTETYFEIMSNNTKHCWIIQKHNHADKFPIWIHHKHTKKTPYYHRHGHSFTVSHAVKIIKGHDSYVLKKQPTTLASCSTS